MNNHATTAGLVATLVLAGCGGGGGGGGGGLPATAGTTTSSFGTIGVASQVNADLSGESNDSVSNIAVGRVAFVTGVDRDTGQVVAISAVAPGPTVGATVTNGNAVYNSTYEYDVIDNITVSSGGLVRGDRLTETGPIALNADFDAGTLTGTGAELTVNGTIAGNAVGGTVTANYSGVALGGGAINGTITGPLQGSIGATGVIGAFHGNNANATFAGGVVGTP